MSVNVSLAQRIIEAGGALVANRALAGLTGASEDTLAPPAVRITNDDVEPVLPRVIAKLREIGIAVEDAETRAAIRALVINTATDLLEAKYKQGWEDGAQAARQAAGGREVFWGAAGIALGFGFGWWLWGRR